MFFHLAKNFIFIQLILGALNVSDLELMVLVVIGGLCGTGQYKLLFEMNPTKLEEFNIFNRRSIWRLICPLRESKIFSVAVEVHLFSVLAESSHYIIPHIELDSWRLGY